MSIILFQLVIGHGKNFASIRSIRPEVVFEKVFLEDFSKFTEKHRKTPSQVFSREFCEIFTNGIEQVGYPTHPGLEEKFPNFI